MSIEDIKDGLAERTESSGDIDYIQLIESTGIIGKIATLVFGFLATAIMIIVPLIVTIEIIYICFPIIREKIDDLIVKVENKGIANKVLGFTLRDAKRAVEEANTVMIGQKSALWIYLKLKCTSMTFLMFILALVIMGSSTIVNFVWKLFEGIFATIS